MKATSPIIDLLNEVLTLELTATNQYYLHARICENWGYERLWKKIRTESIEEMQHADRLIKRVLFLGGLPNVQRYNKVTIGESVKEMFTLDLVVEKTGQAMLNKGIETCRAAGDNGSREVLESILHDTEEHLDWLEGQLELMKQVGEFGYLAEQIKVST